MNIMCHVVCGRKQDREKKTDKLHSFRKFQHYSEEANVSMSCLLQPRGQSGMPQPPPGPPPHGQTPQ